MSEEPNLEARSLMLRETRVFDIHIMGTHEMSKFAKFNEYDQVRLKQDRPSVSEHPFTQLDEPRAVTTNDKGIILTVYGGPNPGYDVEFFDEQGNTLDLLMIDEHELELW